MAVILMAQAFKLKVGSAGKKLVLLKLADNANDKGECWPSYQHIADQCEISRRSSMRYINELINDGYLKKELRKGIKGNTSNVYVLNLHHQAPITTPSDTVSPPPSDTQTPPSDRLSPPPSDTVSPGISHSLESVNEVKRVAPVVAPTRKPKFDPKQFVPDTINYEAWCEWVEFRRAKRKPISEIAAKKQLGSLQKLTPEQQQMTISHSIENDYQGLFPDKFSKPQSQFESAQERKSRRWEETMDYDKATTW